MTLPSENRGVPPGPRIGVLALQGCVMPHFPHLEAAGGIAFAVKTAADLARADGLVLPGGESSAMLRLLAAYGLERPLADALRRVPAWGICAGVILLAGKVRDPAQRSLGALDITVVRNGYGRQAQSFTTEIAGHPVAFIRAPIIEGIGPGVETLARVADRPVWVRNALHMGTTFHPELARSHPSPMHTAFVAAVRERARK